MSKYKINDEIVNAYINGQDLTPFKIHDCYSFGLKGSDKQEPAFFDPDPAFRNDISRATNEIKNIVEDLDLTKIEKVNRFIGDLTDFDNSIEIVLIVGYPTKIKYITYVNEDNSKAFVVLDVLNILMYYGQLDIMNSEVTKYLKYILVNLMIGTKIPVEFGSKIDMLESLIFCSSFADYISDVNHWATFVDATPVASILEYNEFIILNHVERKHDEAKAEKYVYTVVSCDPEVYDFAITGKRYLSGVSEDKAFELFSKKPKEFVINVLENKDNKRAIMLPSLSRWLTITCIIVSAIYVAWFIPAEFFNFFTFIHSLIPFPFAILFIIRGLINYKMGIYSNKKFYLYTLIAFTLTICYLIFMF